LFFFFFFFFFFGVFMKRDGAEVHSHAKKNEASARSIEDLLHGMESKFFLRDTVRNPEQARYRHPASSASQSQCRIWFTLPAQGASHIIILHITYVISMRT